MNYYLDTEFLEVSSKTKAIIKICNINKTNIRMESKSLGNTDQDAARKNVSDRT